MLNITDIASQVDCTISIIIDSVKDLQTGNHIFENKFINMHKKFNIGSDIKIQLKSVVAYAGEFGMFLNAACNDKIIGIGVHPSWITDDEDSLIDIDSINLVLMTKSEMARMISRLKAQNRIGEVMEPIEPVIIDDYDLDIKFSSKFAKQVQAKL